MSLNVSDIQRLYIEGILSKDFRDHLPGFVFWFKCRYLATIVAGIAFGNDWFEEVLASEGRPAYFQHDFRSENTYPRSTTRVIEVGEMVWNLHTVNGFEERANDIRTDLRNAETKIGELMGGRFFHQLGIPFSFRNPKGQMQDDYDIDYMRIDNKQGRCEVKCKLQATEFSVKTIGNSCKQAKKQLPKHETGIILLRTPEDWVPLDNGIEKFQAIIKSVNDWFAAEKTKRISSIVVFDSRTDVVDSTVHTNCYYKEYKNPHCSDSPGLPECLGNEEGFTILPSNWTRIHELVDAWEHRLGSNSGVPKL